MSVGLSPKAALVRHALAAAGLDAQVLELQESTRTAQDAADAIGCRLGQIVKSLLFKTRRTARPVLVLASGSTRVDVKKLRLLVGEKIGKASAEYVRTHTGYAIGGVAPVGHPAPLRTFVDRELLQYDRVWAAAGTPHAVFSCRPAFLRGLGTVADLRQDSAP